jgi:hypothetical protein
LATHELRTIAARALLSRVPGGSGVYRNGMERLLVRVETESAAPYRAELGWALDLLDDYDEHVLEHGDEPMRVYSPDHLERRQRIRRMLDEDPGR